MAFANTDPARVELAGLKRALTQVRQAAGTVEAFAAAHPNLSTDEADKHIAMARSHLAKALDWIDESLWLVETEPAAFAA